ncbi:DnaJ family domain-containing protein [Planomonospora parontospora]|uniref:DnaJ family domain-containing protein n=1 Tax=Planomonospora parontospora TaxID=58119 RepID=UPI0016711D12|nr:DUF1992 domain-containing protein [Planomonospora parontospora]GGL51266.1 DUF1992 domain-containing protein [Planomonospora parontospora subsp. antibiotica]GII19084.1 DUF1992 domain-containing protein [Planomonospora parontospora subsp. antibiotica]
MAERKPPGLGFETWIDRQIREATERGEFDDLPGAGKPLPGEGRPYDELWWVKQKMEAENLSFPLPGTLALRKEAEDRRAEAVEARTEAEARKIIGELNERIRESHGKTLSGPPLVQPLLDVEEVAADWRARHPAEDESAPPPGRPAEGAPGPQPSRRRRPRLRWFRRG